jgi:hypothetical protein
VTTLRQGNHCCQLVAAALAIIRKVLYMTHAEALVIAQAIARLPKLLVPHRGCNSCFGIVVRPKLVQRGSLSAFFVTLTDQSSA